MVRRGARVARAERCPGIDARLRMFSISSMWLIMVTEGTGRNKSDGKVVFRAFAVASFDERDRDLPHAGL